MHASSRSRSQSLIFAAAAGRPRGELVSSDRCDSRVFGPGGERGHDGGAGGDRRLAEKLAARLAHNHYRDLPK